MKKLFAAILLLVYFVFSTGFVVSIHYCMDKVDSFQLGVSNSDECSKCGMNISKSHGCCKDEVKVVKMELDQSVAKAVHTNFSLPLLPVVKTDFLYASFSNCSNKDYPIAHSPPINHQDTYLQNCVFRC